MEDQDLLHDNQIIGIEAFVTPIANHFGVPLPRDLVSIHIHLDKHSLQQQEVPTFDCEEYNWKFHELNRVRLIRLPCLHLTSVIKIIHEQEGVGI